ncbi:hypothetical protein AX15_003608 [Amanita polypyramis BW_CC]|nr:hypothetical protein AX15_003608 [Amanita polypyramis BW_CC]
MATPTQEYPPWLTPVPETIYDQDGVPISTSTTILYLPLTYYGPSIPLGPEWTYGGLTPPTLTSTVIVSTIVTPSASTSTATPLTISTAPSSFVTPSSSISTTSTATPSSRHTPLSHSQLIGVIVGAVIGAFVIFLALFVCFLLIKNRRHDQRVHFGNVRSIDPDYIVVDSDARPPGDGSPRHSGEEKDSLLQAHREVADPGSTPRYQKTAQRGVPTDQPVAGPSTQPTLQAPVELGVRPGAPRAPAPPADTHSSGNSRGSGSSTEMSSLGSVIYNSRLSALSPLVEEQREMRRAAAAARFRGPIISPQEQRRVEEETRSESNAKQRDSEGESELTPLPPPPRSIDPENAPPRLVSQSSSSSNSPQVRTALIPHFHHNFKAHDSYGSSKRSSSPTDPEDVALLTARRVKPLDWGVRASPYYYSPLSERQNINNNSSGGIISSITNGLSWFKNLDALPGSLNRRSGPPKNFKSSDGDVEASKALLSPTISDLSESRSSSPEQQMQQVTESTLPVARPYPYVGVNPDSRPLSSGSGRSGQSSAPTTTYHDAYSTLPNTPNLTPLPRAVTPVPGSLGGQPSRESNWRLPSPLSAGISAASLKAESEQVLGTLAEFGGKNIDALPAYDENDTIAREHARELGARNARVDVLDLPAPSALSNFRNAATSGAMPLVALASTSTALSNTNTLTSASAPTLLAQREGTLSTSTSESFVKDTASSTVGESKGDTNNGGPAVETTSNIVHVAHTGTEAFTVKEAKSWSQGSAAGNDTIQNGRATTYYNTSTFPHFNSRETNRTNMTGTTLATIGEDTSVTSITIDLLEDEPPLPGEGWRSLASVAGGESATAVLDGVNRRFTLGAPMPMPRRQAQQDVMLAEIGSLQSMHSHHSPTASNHSTGSMPVSKRDVSGSLDSRSSRPSAQHSLTHSGSISSLEGRRRYPSSSLRYSVYSAHSGREGSTSNGGGISPALSAFGNRIKRQGSEDGMHMPRNLTPLSEQLAVESDSSYYTAPDATSGRSTSGMQDTFHSRMTAQTAGTATGSGVTAPMEVEEDVVDAAQAAMASGIHDQEFGILGPRSQMSDVDGSLGLSSAPWAGGLDQNWSPL